MYILSAEENKTYQAKINNFTVLFIRYIKKININEFVCDAIVIRSYGFVYLGSKVPSNQLPEKWDLLGQQFSPIDNMEFNRIWEDALEVRQKVADLASEFCDIVPPIIDTELPF